MIDFMACELLRSSDHDFQLMFCSIDAGTINLRFAVAADDVALSRQILNRKYSERQNSKWTNSEYGNVIYFEILLRLVQAILQVAGITCLHIGIPSSNRILLFRIRTFGVIVLICPLRKNKSNGFGQNFKLCITVVQVNGKVTHFGHINRFVDLPVCVRRI